MKLAITLIAIGILLFIDGTIRIFAGSISVNVLDIIGGLLTGLLLGGFLFYKGIKRYQRFKQPH